MLAQALKTAKRAVVQVGDGRGFVVSAGEDERFIITTAHCLPREHYPEPHLANSARELTSPRMIGPLGSTRRKQTVRAELCVLSLVDDLAVFTEPEAQAPWKENDRYLKFTAERAMKIGRSPRPVSYKWNADTYKVSVDDAEEIPAWLLSLHGQWQRCTVKNGGLRNGGRYLSVQQGHQHIKSGMSGSCIVDDNGAAIGAVSTSGDGDGGMHPSLTDCLPPWLLRKLDKTMSDDTEEEFEANAT
jgi:hypothetical protein